MFTLQCEYPHSKIPLTYLKTLNLKNNIYNQNIFSSNTFIWTMKSYVFCR
uniref:Uncharacterized protein n=1 Tax=Anguilla anguilla TaxID=7936 RepID=A0A0E9RRD0_ANGAN